MINWLPISEFNPEIHKGKLFAASGQQDEGGFDYAVIEWQPPYTTYHGQYKEGEFMECGEYPCFPDFFIPINSLPQPPQNERTE